MKDRKVWEKILRIVGPVCLAGAACLYILGMVFGSNPIFVCGVICAVTGIVVGKMTAQSTGNSTVFVLSIIVLFIVGSELFMRVRDGYTDSGWYYFYLLQHPEANIWY